MPPLRLQSSKGKLTMSCEIEPVRRPFCRQGSCTFTEVARLAPSGVLDKGFPLKSGSSVDVYIEREMYRCVYINININIYIYIYMCISVIIIVTVIVIQTVYIILIIFDLLMVY